MPGPGSRNSLGKPGPKAQNPGKSFKRIMGYVLKDYSTHYAWVIVCIIASVLCSLQGTLFMKELIDKYITPFLLDPDKLPNFDPLAKAITRVACFYGIGVVASFVQARLLIKITQGTMESMNLKPVEQAKLACAKRLFNNISTSHVRYSAVNSYQELLNVIPSLP